MDSLDLTDHLRRLDPLNAEWVTGVLLAVFAVLAITNVSSPRKWRLLAQAMFRMRMGRQTLREEIDLQDRTFVGLLAASLLVLSLFFWQVAVLRQAQFNFAWIMGMVALALVAQALLLRLVGTLSGSDPGITEYRSTGLVLFIVSGLALLPVVVLVAYRSPWREALLPLGMGLVVLLLLYRWVRGAWVGLGEGVPIRYIILYFCAAEIVPVLLVVHALRSGLPPSTHP